MLKESCRHASSRLALGFVLTALIAAAALAATAMHASAKPRSSQADALRSIEHERLKALVDGDAAKARPLMARDFQLINPGGATFSRSEYLGAVQAGAVDYLKFQPASPIVVRRYGNVAALRYMVDFDLIVSGTRLTHKGWITELWERHGGRWQIVWEQSTAIPNNFGLFVQSLLPPS